MLMPALSLRTGGAISCNNQHLAKQRRFEPTVLFSTRKSHRFQVNFCFCKISFLFLFHLMAVAVSIIIVLVLLSKSYCSNYDHISFTFQVKHPQLYSKVIQKWLLQKLVYELSSNRHESSLRRNVDKDKSHPFCLISITTSDNKYHLSHGITGNMSCHLVLLIVKHVTLDTFGRG